MNDKIKVFRGKTLSYFKYENSRVAVQTLPSGDYGLHFRVLSDYLGPRTIHKVTRECIVDTLMTLSPEAALSLWRGLTDRLEADGIIEQENPQP